MSRARGRFTIVFVALTISACVAPTGRTATSPSAMVSAESNSVTAPLPVDVILAPVSKTAPTAEASDAMSLCFVHAFGLDTVAGMAKIPKARDLPKYLRLVGVEPEIQTDVPAWAIQFTGKLTLPRGLGWAVDPSCVVIGGERFFYLTGPHGRGDTAVDPLPPDNPPSVSLPPLAP